MRLLVRLSGEHPTLPEAELRAVLEADGHVWTEVARKGHLLIGDLRPHAAMAPGSAELARSVSRLAMTREVAIHRITTERTARGVQSAAEDVPHEAFTGHDSFAVRAERVDPADERTEVPGRVDVERDLGGTWRAHARVDLEHPEVLFRAWLDRDHVHIGDVLWVNDRGGFEARAIKHRPYFSPVSGHPRWMRALVNLVAASPPDVVYDPLCGTGGVLLEAALAGHRVVGSDLDPRMVEGSQVNLEHGGSDSATLFQSNVRETPQLFAQHTGLDAPGCIVTDLPYGQSSSTGKEGTRQVARWTLEAIRDLLPTGHRAVVGVADPSLLEPLPVGLQREQSFALRVHKSLTRTFVVLRAVL